MRTWFVTGGTPGGFGMAYADAALEAYRRMLEGVRSAMIAQDGAQPGDPRRGARAVIAAMAEDPPPRRLVFEIRLNRFVAAAS